jgi:hypothetical protein
MHLCEKDYKDASKVWERLPEDQKEEVSPFCRHFKFPGQGQQVQNVITFPGAIKLIMFLPGEKAKHSRSAMTEIIQRYFAGDPSLLAEIEANAKSSHPIAQMARESLAADQEMSPEDKALDYRKRKLEIDTAEQEKNMKHIRFEHEQKESELKIKNEQLEFARKLSPNGQIDDQLRMLFKDSLANSIRNDSGQAPVHTDDSLKPICLSSVATDLGFRFNSGDLQAIGKQLAHAYLEKHGSPPGKHEQFVNGAARLINLYTRKDRPLIEQTMRDHHVTLEKQKTTAVGRTLNQFWTGPQAL